MFSLPHHLHCQINAVLDGLITFGGGNLLTCDDLKDLIGNAKGSREKWVSNFVIDKYLKLVKSACAEKGAKVETLAWETFEKGVPFLFH